MDLIPVVLVIGVLALIVVKVVSGVRPWAMLAGIGLVLLVVAAMSAQVSVSQNEKAKNSLDYPFGTAEEFEEANSNSDQASTIAMVSGGLGALAVVSGLVMRSAQGSVTMGSIIKTRHAITLKDGSNIPAGFTAKVEELDVIDGTPVILLVGPSGASHWISKANAHPV